MAWTWRKRKSILPGVRLNFGKRGISTTVGPRGASMTFGPNGTYLNTSIPGTGLYNRQKIGGPVKNMDNNTDNNGGCREILLYLSAIVVWAFVALVVLMLLATDIRTGLIFSGVVIITHVIVALLSYYIRNKRNRSQVLTGEISSTSSQGATKNTNISKENSFATMENFFSEVAKVVNELYSDYEKILQKSNLESLINEMGVDFVMNGTPMTNVKEKVHLLFFVDIVRCYVELGHPLNLSTKEGLGAFYLYARSKGCPNIESYTNFLNASVAYRFGADSYFKGIKGYVDNSPLITETFFMSRLLSSNDTNLHRKFLIDIYRFASITAKADKTITREEANWLSDILKLQGGGNQEFEPMEDEEDQELTPVSAPHIPRLDPIFADVARYVVDNQEGSTSRLQRVFEIGYNRAGKLSDQLEAAGIVGPNKGPAGREVLIKDKVYLERLLMGILGDNYTKADGGAILGGSVMSATKSKTKDPTKMLDKLIGLDSVKKEVETLSNFIKIQQTRATKGLKTSAVSYHCVFTGNPGTGKTTVARILAKIYKDLGVVSKGHLVETDRSGLVAEYVGQTAVKTNKIIDSALDGVLFIDEAYSLVGGGASDYGKEAIATLLKRMEDNRDRLIVILAGYTKNMKDFIDSNPGLQSRFNRYIEFPDYSAEELLQIFEVNMKKYEYHFGEGAKEALLQYFVNEVARKDANFGNGRLVRNVFEKTLERQANRLAREVNLTTDKLSLIEIEDLPLN